MATTENVNENYRLVELGGSGYEMVKGEPDIRGWEVKDIQQRLFGKVDEVLFDKESEKVRYIVLNMKANELNLKSRKVLIPIGLAQLDEHHDDLIFPDITAIHLSELPEYKKTPVTYDQEEAIRKIFESPGSSQSTFTGTDYYQHKHFDDSHLHGNTPASSSERAVGSSPGAEYANAEPLGQNENSASPTTLKPFEEGTIEFTEKREIPVITKEAKVVEEISLNKEVEEHDATVHDTVRKTDIEIERNDRENAKGLS